MVEVIKSGLYDTIQDLGRFGFQHVGVPYSGVMDRESAQLANKVLSNDLNDAVMEITMLGPKLKFQEPTIIAISGADLGAQMNKEYVALNVPILLRTGDELSFGKLNKGCRAYLAIKGGFQSEVVMNSRSWFSPVTGISRLKKGMLIPYETWGSEGFESNDNLNKNVLFTENNHLDVFLGPEYDLLSASQKKTIKDLEFSIATTSNRMAYQFEETIPNDLPEIITAHVLPGTVQLTPSGRVIVLMRDAQVTGGYPRIFQLSEGSINRLSQKAFGKKVRFKCINK